MRRPSARPAERGKAPRRGRYPAHMTATDELSAIEYCYEQGWTDGLPVVPPERHLVERFLAAAGRPSEEVVAEHLPTGRACSVESAAINAVMAGCLPQYFPTVLAALEALGQDAYNFHGASASTGGSAPALVLSGDIADEIGMNAGVNVFGPGARANATIGRAVRLVILNVFQMTPGIADRSTTGWPGKYSCCIAENAAHCPWPPLHESLGFPAEVSTVTAFAASGFYNIENHYTSDPQALLGTFADTMSSLGALTDGQSLIVLSPEHAAICANAGLARRDVQEFLFEHAQRPGRDLIDAGKWPADRASDGLAEGRSHDADGSNADFRRGREPADMLVVVAGGEAGGHSAFLPSWSRGRNSLYQTRPIGVCLDC